MNKSRLALQILLPIAVVGAGAGLAYFIASKAKRPAVVAPPPTAPFVQTIVAKSETLRLDVATQGTIEPFRTIELTTQVGGRIESTSPSLRTGGTCNVGDVLLVIDATDLQLAVVQQQAAIARAELHLLQERAEADAAVRAWGQLEGDRKPDPLVLRTPQIRDAEMALAAARAQLEKIQLDLGRTKVKAPVSGRVRTVAANVGQTVQPGQQLAMLLDTSCVEVRLPIPVSEAAFLDLPLENERTATGPTTVTLTADFAGQRYSWSAHLVRTEGEIDRRTRQLTVVARVAGEQANGDGAGRPPLLVGMFVEATIAGREFSQVVALPRTALMPDSSVWVVVPSYRGHIGWVPLFEPALKRTPVDVLRTGAERIVLQAGVTTGQFVCVTVLDAPVEGMLVRRRPETKR